ncbi:uncharacterized protein LOC136072242 [Hydra vulgaris]|uniref:uncharacterized protein LOC136072242 n=1 Tax=Hydra vulgaris TaxID=6087 RepID=UPI0032E9F73F
MGLPCKHMFAARRAKKLQMFSENCIAPRWFKETVQKNHCVFLTKEQHDSHIKFAKLKDKPLTHIEKYRRANRLVQHLSDLAAEGGSSQFECRMRVLQNLASIWGSNNEAMVTSIQHHFVDFNIQNGCSKLEIEDDIFRSELRERKFEMTDSSEEVVEVVNVEKNDKSNFHPNSRFERPGCSGEVESNTVQNSIFKRPGCSGEVESNTVQNSIFERPGCSGEVESNTIQNFTVSCEDYSFAAASAERSKTKDVTVVTPADIADLNLEAKDLPSALMNEIVVLEILKPFLTTQAWKILRASFLRRKKMKMWNCPICLLNAPTESIECSSCLECMILIVSSDCPISGQ